MADDFIDPTVSVASADAGKNTSGDFVDPTLSRQSLSAAPPGFRPPPAYNSEGSMKDAAGFFDTIKASLAPDVKDQIKHYSQSMGIPENRFDTMDGNIVYADQEGTYHRVTPSVFGGGGPVDTFKRAGNWLASQIGPAIPSFAGAGAGIAPGVGPWSVPVAAGAAGVADVARQGISNSLIGKDVMDIDWMNSAGHAAMGGVGQGGGVLLNKLMTRNPMGIGAFDRANALDPATRQRVSDLMAEAKTRGIDLSGGQATGLRSLMARERNLGRYDETTDLMYDFARKQREKQIPAAIRAEISNISPKSGEAAVKSFREGAEGVVDASIERRTAASDPIYKEAFQGGSIAPLEDQLRSSLQKATGAKGQIAKEIAQIESDSPGALISKGAAGAETRARYMDLHKQLAQAEADRVSVMEMFKRAQGDAAANAPGAVWNPRIQQFLDDPITKSGLARGIEIQRLEALAKGEKFNPTEYAITGVDDAGKPIVGSVPNMRTLDSVKNGLDAIIQEEKNALTGKPTRYGRAVDMARRSFLSEIDEISPTYARARATFAADSTGLDDLLEGGVGFVNKMTGMDRQNIVNRVFSAQNITPEGVARARNQFAMAGKLDDWNAGISSFLSDKLADAMKVNTSGSMGNVPGKFYTSIWGDERQQAIVKAALDPQRVKSIEKFMEVINAASRSLPEGSPTATDLMASSGSQTVSNGLKVAGKIASPGAWLNVGDEVVKGIDALRTPGERIRLAKALTSGDYDKQLSRLRMLPPNGQRASSAAGQILTSMGIGSTGVRVPSDFAAPGMQPQYQR
jgi:hypothetical protein